MKYTLVFLCLFFFSQIYAQTSKQNPNRNAIYAEFYAIPHDFNEGYVSLNYERNVGKKRRHALRVGIYPDFQTLLALPVTFTRITFPEKKHHIEYGLGLVYRIEFFEGNVYRDVGAAMFPLMYRYENDRNLVFRGGVNLWFSYPILPTPSVSLGFKF